MRIGIDARFYGPLGKGLGRYTQKLIESLEDIDSVNKYFVFLRKENFDEYQPRNKNFEKVLADYRWYTFAEQLKFPKLLNNYRLDLIHFPHFNVPLFYSGKFVVTIHDLILLRFPTMRSTTLSPAVYWLKFLAYRLVIGLAIRRSKRIFAVSDFTKNDILANYPQIKKEKITVTYEACDDYCFFNPKKEEEILFRYGIIKPYFLYVGNAYPHKNPERLISAFKDLEKQKPELKLVFVAAEDYFYRRLKELVKREGIKNIIFAGFVPDHDLDLIFRAAIAYIRPSLYEGFELPPLEAMARGVPVICSDHTCAREILEDSVFYFDPKNEKDIAQAMAVVASDEKLRNDLLQKGYQQVKKYSWKKMTHLTLATYEEVLKDKDGK